MTLPTCASQLSIDKDGARSFHATAREVGQTEGATLRRVDGTIRLQAS